MLRTLVISYLTAAANVCNPNHLLPWNPTNFSFSAFCFSAPLVACGGAKLPQIGVRDAAGPGVHISELP